MADIFISYASADRSRIAPLVGALEAVGYSVWWDQALKGGHQFSREIENALKEARAAIVIWSEASLQSHWVADEAELARREGKLIPIRLDDIEPPMGFRQFQTLNFTAWDGETGKARLSDLLSALEGCFARGQSADGAPPPPLQSPPPHLGNGLQEIPAASIAVLPFVNMSSDPEQEFFSDGISEELLNLLAKIKDFTVIARTSSFAFKGKDLSVTDIGQRLRCAHVLEGSVRKAGNRVRITAQLIEAGGGTHLWSETYDRDLDDIFAIQDEISAAIVEELKPLLLPNVSAPKSRPQEDMEAYQDYLLGHQLLLKRTREDIERALEAFDRALLRDPGYAEALIGKADALILLSGAPGCYGNTPHDEAIAAAKPLLDLAERLAPDLDILWTVRALAHRIKSENAGTMAMAKRAIEINPNNSRAWGLLGHAQTNLGNPSEFPIIAYSKAVELEPLSLAAISLLIPEKSKRLQFEEAQALIERCRAISPDSQVWRIGQGTVYLMQGHYGKELELLVKERAFIPPARVYYQSQLHAVLLGDPPDLVNPHPTQFDVLLDAGRMEEADAVYDAMRPNDILSQVQWDGVRMRAIWHYRHGRMEEADQLLTDLLSSDERGWGPGYNLGGICQAAFLHFDVKRALGEEAAASAVLGRLKIVAASAEANPHGPPKTLDVVKANIAAAEGRIDEAAGRLHAFFDETMMYCYSICNAAILRPYTDHPEIKRLVARSNEHLEKERLYAESAGVLPLPGDVLTIMDGSA